MASKRDWSKYSWFRYKNVRGVRLQDSKGNSLTIRDKDLFGVKEVNKKIDHVVVVKDPTHVFSVEVAKVDKILATSTHFKGKVPLSVEIDDKPVVKTKPEYVWYKYTSPRGMRIISPKATLSIKNGVVFGVLLGKTKAKCVLQDKLTLPVSIDIDKALILIDRSLVVQTNVEESKIPEEAPPAKEIEQPLVETKKLTKEERLELIKKIAHKLEHEGKIKPHKIQINLDDIDSDEMPERWGSRLPEVGELDLESDRDMMDVREQFGGFEGEYSSTLEVKRMTKVTQNRGIESVASDEGSELLRCLDDMHDMLDKMVSIVRKKGGNKMAEQANNSWAKAIREALGDTSDSSTHKKGTAISVVEEIDALNNM